MVRLTALTAETSDEERRNRLLIPILGVQRMAALYKTHMTTLPGKTWLRQHLLLSQMLIDL